MKNRVTVTIAGQEYTLVATEEEGYVEKVAQHVDAQMKQVLSGAGSGGLGAVEQLVPDFFIKSNNIIVQIMSE